MHVIFQAHEAAAATDAVFNPCTMFSHHASSCSLWHYKFYIDSPQMISSHYKVLLTLLYVHCVQKHVTTFLMISWS